jgi:hypothetical protein
VEISTGQASSRQGEVIPTKRPERGITLNEERLRQILADTAEVSKMLGIAMRVDEEESEEGATHPPAYADAQAKASEEKPNVASGPVSDDRFAGLDLRFHTALAELLTRDTWERDNFDALARRFGLMPNGLLESVNTWSDEHLGDFLIEDDKPIRINIRLVEGG